jgi:predicted DNA-binding transcriptional regulator YafY
MEGYRLPPVMFTREEAGSFVAAGKLMEQFTDKTLGAHHASAMYKLKSVLRGTEKDWVAALESHISVTPSRRAFNEHIPDALDILFESMARKTMVSLRYQSFEAGEITERGIEPVGVFHENNYWYVMAYCHLRKDYRQFRADRMIHIKRKDTPFTRIHGQLEAYRKEGPNAGKFKVRLLVSQNMCRYIRESRHYYGFISEEIKGDQVEMTFMTSDQHDGFSRWYLMFGDCAQILEPESLKERVRGILDQMVLNL